jgi:hypothetical protein
MAQQAEIAQLYYTLGARVDASTQQAVAQQATALDEIAQVAEQAGVPIGSLQAAVEQLVDEVEGELRSAVQRMGKEMDAAGISAAVLAEQTEAVAEASAQSLGALSAQVRLYAQGTQIAATRQQSLTQLAGIEQLLKGRLDQGNLTLEQRIRLQQVLAQTQAATALATARGAAAIATTSQATARASEAVKAFGDRWSGTALNIVTAASSIVQSGNVSSGGLKAVLLGATQLAGFLGAGGALVVAAGVAANAIISVFTKAREEARKTQEEFAEMIARLQDEGDVVGIVREAEKLYLGKASKNFQDGVRALEENVKQLDAAIALRRELEAKAKESLSGSFGAAAIAGAPGAARDNPLTEVRRALEKERDSIVATLKEVNEKIEFARKAAFGPSPKAKGEKLPIETSVTSPEGDESRRKKRQDELDATAESYRQIGQAVDDVLQSVASGETTLAAFDREVREINDDFAALEKKGDVTKAQKEGFAQLAAKLAFARKEVAAFEGAKAARELEKIAAALTPSLLDDMALSTRELVEQLDRLKAPPDVRAQLLGLKRTLDDVTLSGQAFEKRLAGIGDSGLPPLRQMVALGELQREKEAELLGITEKGYAADQKRAAIKAQLAKIEAQQAQLAGQQQVTEAKTVESASQLLLVLQETSSAAFGIATAFRGADATLTKMIGGTAQVAAGLSRISELAAATDGGLSKLLSSGAGIASILPAVGGVIGGVGAVLSAVRGLGNNPSPVEQEQLRLYAENNKRLAELRVALDKQITITVGSAKAATVRDFVTVKEGQGVGADGEAVFGFVNKSIRDVLDGLSSLGISLEELRVLAKNFQVQLSDAPTVEQIQQLQEAIRTLDFKKLTEGLEGQLDLLDLRKRINPDAFKGLTGVGAQLDILAKRVPALRDALEGIDLNAAGGPVAAMGRLRALFEAFTNGEIDLSQLGEITDPGAFAALIAQLIEAIRDAVPETKSASDRFAAALELLGVQLEFGTLTLEQRLERAKLAFAQLFPELAASLDTSSAEAFRESIKAIIDGFAADGDLSDAERAQIEVLRALLAAFKDVTDAAEAAADAAREQAEAEEEKRRKESEEADRKAKDAADAAAKAEEERRRRVLALAEAYIRANDITDPIEQLRIRLNALGDAFPALRAQLALFDVSTEEGRKALEAFVQLMIGTPENLEALADALGISVDELTQMLLDLEEGADSAAASVATLAARLQIAFDAVNFDLALENVTDPIERLRRTVAGLAGVLPDLDAALAGLDLSSESGRAQAEQRLIALAKSSTDAAVRDAVLQLLQQIRAIAPGQGSGLAPSFGGADTGGDVRFGAFATGTVVQFDRIITLLTDIESHTRTLALGAPRVGGVRPPVLPLVPSAVVTTSLAGASGASMVVNVYATINIGAGVSPETARVALDEGGERIRRQVENVVETGGARRLLRSQRARGIPLQT